LPSALLVRLLEAFRFPEGIIAGEGEESAGDELEGENVLSGRLEDLSGLASDQKFWVYAVAHMR
jgi:hypothetical protein